MIDPISVSVAGTLFKNAKGEIRRLYRERQAGNELRQPETVLDTELKKTIRRLRMKPIEEVWWKNILNSIGNQYIAPDFLKKPSIQEWLSDTQNESDLFFLAKDIVMGGEVYLPDCKDRLALSYSDYTGEDRNFSTSIISAVSSILAAGCLAPLQQESGSPVHEREVLFGSQITLTDFSIESYNERIDTLEKYAREDGFTLNQSSYLNFSEFLDNYQPMKRASVVLLENGNLRANWKNKNGAYVALQFLDQSEIQFVLFSETGDDGLNLTNYGTGDYIKTMEQIQNLGLDQIMIA